MDFKRGPENSMLWNKFIVRENKLNSYINAIASGLPCDVTLVAGISEHKYPVHREKMIKFSPYLKTLLDPKYIGDGRPEIIFNGIDGETLQTIIDYCYNDGYTDITVRNALQVMEVASNLEMHQLEKCCSKMNYHYIWWYAMDPDKSRKSIRHICSNFENVPIAEIVNIDEMYFRKILQETKIVAAESIIFDRLMKWVQHKETKRSACMAKLAPLIRLQHLPYEFLRDTVRPFYDKHGCVQLVFDEFNIRSPDLTSEGRLLPLHRFSPCPDTMYCATWKKTNKIEILEWEHRKWMGMRTITVDEDSFQILHTAYTNGKIFVFGVSVDDDSALTRIKMMSHDLWTSETVRLREMRSIEMISCSPVVVGKYIYVIGKSCKDRNEEFFHGQCERYDIESASWERLAPLPLKMRNLSAVESGNLVYVIGETRFELNLWCYGSSYDRMGHMRDLWTEKRSLIAEDFKPVHLFKARQRICMLNNQFGFQTYDAVFNRWNQLYEDSRGDPDYETESEVDYPEDSEDDQSEREEDSSDDESDSVSQSNREFDDLEVLTAIDYHDKTYGIWSSPEGIQFGIVRPGKPVVEFDDFESNGREQLYHLFIR